MAEKYNDLYIRASLNDPGNIPRTGMGLSSSPDIIPYGIMPVENPVKFFSDNFNKVLSQDLLYNAPNYVYLRGQNLYNGARKGKMYAYYCPSNLLLVPSTWKENRLYTQAGAGEQDYVEVTASAVNSPYVTPEPFVWTPAYPAPNFHYCMISRVTTDEHPNPIPATGSYSDFATWVAGNGGIGWRNVTVIQGNPPEVLFKSAYDQEEEAGLMDILITAKGCPNGSEVWFSSGTPLPDGRVIAIPPTKISQNPQTWGTQAFIPANWATTFSGAYRSNGLAPLPGWDVSLRVQFAPTTTSKLYAIGQPIEELGLGDWHMFHHEKRIYMPCEEFYRHDTDAFANGPIKPVLLGSVTLKGSD